MNHACRQLAHETRSGGGLLLLRRKAPLTRRSVVYFCSGAHMYGYTDVFWAGADDYKQPTDPKSQILSNIASMVNALTSSPKRYLILASQTQTAFGG